MQIIKTEINHEDERGIIMDLIEGKNINAITIVTINAGHSRGNHYHKKTTQYNYITKGKVKFMTQFGDDEVNSKVLESGDFAVTVPMEKHAFTAVEYTEMMVFTEGPRGGKEYESDTYRLEKALSDI